MMRVGLTGGIGSGKSTIAGFFRDLGIPVYDSDGRARALMEEDKALREEIIRLFGPSAFINGKLNRSHIASHVFGDRPLLDQLNALVHPVVREDFLQWSERQQAPYVIQEAAILIENGAHRNLDRTILVVAPPEERIRRVMERDSVSREAVLARMRNQWSDEEKIPLADYVIENTSLPISLEKVGQVHREILEISGVQPES
jgi:dephospho-CoA kinase